MEPSLFDMLDDLDYGPQVPVSAEGLAAINYEQPQSSSRRRIDHQYESSRSFNPGGAFEAPLDAFDKELLRRPIEDRHAQAEQGRARLSLAPKASRYFDGGSTQATQRPLEIDRDLQKGSNAAQHLSIRDLAARFAYDNSQAHESSSDSQAVLSSPAMRASQRRSDVGPVVPKALKGHWNKDDSTQAESSLSQSFQPSYLKATPTSSGMSASQRRSVIGPRIPLIPRPAKRSLDEGDSRHAEQSTHQVFKPPYLEPAPKRINLAHAAPMAQGITLVPVTELSDRLRTIFPFPLFNAIQSKCFQQVYKSSDNFVLSSPTGSGKTAVLELAICRAINQYPNGQFKIVYQAPIKSLCSERQRDWQKKFGPLGLRCEELTGDSEVSQIRNVQSASIIITTPEKWDSMTRKWKDHEKLMQLIKLFLIDEVHILKDERGATLEAVVSRMKSVSSEVRFVALSATVPNFKDVAEWLGKDTNHPDHPAANEQFGEQFRPVKLQKHVCGYQSNSNNEFGFEKMLDNKLPEVIAKYSHRKPIMIFCPTRASSVATAKLLANWWATKGPRDRYWEAPSRQISFVDETLRTCASSAVAFHHAGLDSSDRLNVENGFLQGDLNVICCTSTLAVGVNLPCHFVIIKNTVYFAGASLMNEYADLEIMQMLGRAGRPQFDDSAVAVIMTRQHKVRRYELMVSGQDLLESCLHLNLIDHLNAEIGLGTITSLQTAKKWLAGTFLFVRLKKNPDHYKLEGARSGQEIDELLDGICSKDVDLLQDTNLVSAGETLECTEFGHTMARYYVQFETMKVFLALPPKAKISEILSALAQAVEFKELRFRAGEKPLFKDLNKSPSIRFPIPVDLALPMHKTSLIIQSHLGGAELSFDEKTTKHRQQYFTETSIIFKHINRLVRCIIDCELNLEDSVAIRNALMLERSLGARAWDDSPLQIKQVDQLGVVSIRKLVNGGISSLEVLENTEPYRIEMVLNRNPPFGMRLHASLKLFPKLHVSVNLIPNSVAKCGEGVKIQVRAEIGFMNEKPATQYLNKPVYVCFLAETSDGHKVHFARMSGQRLGKGQDLVFSVLLTCVDQSVNGYVMCDEIAGTMRHATLKPELPPSMFPAPKPQAKKGPEKPTSNTSRRRAEDRGPTRNISDASDEFGDGGLDDSDLVVAGGGDLDFAHIEDFGNVTSAMTLNNTAKNAASKIGKRKADGSDEEEEDAPRQLENGKWPCNHRCGDKTKCKHGACCREGLDKPSKRAKKKAAISQSTSIQAGPSRLQQSKGLSDKIQTKLKLTVTKKRSSADVEHLDLTQEEKRKNYATLGPRDFVQLNQLHSSIQKKEPSSSVSAIMHKKPAYSYSKGDTPVLSFMSKEDEPEHATSTNYEDSWMDDLTPPSNPPKAMDTQARHQSVTDEQWVSEKENSPIHKVDSGSPPATPASLALNENFLFNGDDSELEDAMVGLADSHDLQDTQWDNENNQYGDYDFGEDFHILEDDEKVGDQEERYYGAGEDEFIEEGVQEVPAEAQFSSSTTDPQVLPIAKGQSLFCNNNSSSQAPIEGNTSNTSYPASEVPVKNLSRYAAFTNMHSSTGFVAVGKENVPIENDATGAESNETDGVLGIVVPPGFEGVETWLLAEFGDVVEFV